MQLVSLETKVFWKGSHGKAKDRKNIEKYVCLLHALHIEWASCVAATQLYLPARAGMD